MNGLEKNGGFHMLSLFMCVCLTGKACVAFDISFAGQFTDEHSTLIYVCSMRVLRALLKTVSTF